jgi:hypothetical protein
MRQKGRKWIGMIWQPKTKTKLVELINKESGKTLQNYNITIKKGHNLITNPQIIADSFNNFFIDVVEDLLLQRNKYESKFKSKSKIQRCSETMFVPPLTVTEMESLNKNSSAGCDEIPMLLIKQCLGYIIKPLVHIYNVSFQSGIFPDQMKIAKIKPLFKKT